MADLFDRKRKVVEQPFSLPDFQLIEVRHDSATECLTEAFFGSSGTRSDLASDFEDAQTVLNASHQESTNLLRVFLSRCNPCDLSSHSILDLTQKRQQSSGERDRVAGLFRGEMIGGKPEAVMQFLIARRCEAI